eukprot:5107850-Pyramimonas_sp.AAC.1
MVDVLPDWPVAAWDAALTDLLRWAFDLKVARATTAKLGVAVLGGLPQLHLAPLQRCFPQLAHSLPGWKRLHMSSVVPVTELQQPGKTGELDHTVVRVSPRQQALVWALVRLRDPRLCFWHPLWDFVYSLFLRQFGQ